MSFDLGKLFIEWRRIVPNGVPNPGNAYHLVLLKEICLAKGMDREVVDNVILTLEQDDEKIKWKDKDGKDRETSLDTIKQYASDIKRGDSDQNKKLAVAAADLEDKEKGGEEDEVEKKPPMQIDKNPFDKKDDSGKDGQTKEEPKSKEELQKVDKERVDSALNMTKTEAKAQAKSKEKKNVGAGTAESRAGEAMVHRGLQMIKEGKSLEDIEKFFTDLVNEKDHVLNSKKGKEWVGSALASLNAINDEIGWDEIGDIAWDTDEGRESIGVDTKLETSSDMFVRTKDGRNIGVSLKKDSKVFLNNGGWMEQSTLLLNDLKEVMPDDVHEELTEAMSYPNFQVDRAKRFQEAFANYTPEQILELVNSLTEEEIKSESLNKYIKYLKNPKEHLEKIQRGGLGLDRGDGPVMKGFHRLLKLRDEEGDKKIRESDNVLTQKTFNVLNKSPEAKNGMNKHILRSMHVLDALGLKKELKTGGVDGFVTTFGIPPDGAVLNEKNLTDLFGSEVSAMIVEGIDEVRAGNKEPKDLEDLMAEKIEIDYDSGQIFFKHENELKYPLFYMTGRSRGIGTPPVMELGQTPFMGWALKFGSFNTDEWTPDQIKRLKGDLAQQAKERAERSKQED